jgi:TonB family protein
LIPLLKDEELNYIVPWSLGQIGDKSAIPPLIKTLDDSNPDMRVLAIYSLEQLDAKQALPKIRALLGDQETIHFDGLIPVSAAAKEAVIKLERAPQTPSVAPPATAVPPRAVAPQPVLKELPPQPGPIVVRGVYSAPGHLPDPVPIYKPDPAYTEEARKAKLQGVVVLWIIVNASGAVTDYEVVKPLGLGLDEKAVEIVKTWKFKPAMIDGSPVPVRILVEVPFRLSTAW